MVAALTSLPSSAAPCAPAVADEGAASLPEAWRRELDALVAASGRGGHPWSCTGARLSLSPAPDGRGATLAVEDAAGRRERGVEAPEDLVPIGKALLAITIAPAPPPPPTPPAADAAPPIAPPPPALPAPKAAGPRLALLVDALAETRFSGPTEALWAGASLRGTAAIDAWLAGLWARYEAPIAVFDRVPPDFTMSSVSIGLAGGRRLLAAPVELDVTFEPSLAVVLTGGRPDPHGEVSRDAQIDPRLGARLGMGVPLFGSRFRALVALDGEIAPGAFDQGGQGGPGHHGPPPLPSRPAYTIGLSIGAELTLQ